MPESPIRPAGQAGRFYPADADSLRQEIEAHLQATDLPETGRPPIGFVSPHAGYPFSGPTAAHTYRQLQALQPEIVFIFAPSHHAMFSAAAIWEGTAYRTPLGDYPIDQDYADRLRQAIPEIHAETYADLEEHSLEVQIPFLQVACPQARLVPLLVGDQKHENTQLLVEGVGRVLDETRPEGPTVFVASSDAYHGHSLVECRRSDSQLAEDLKKMDTTALYEDTRAGRAMACGYGPLAAVMELSRRLGAKTGQILHQTNSCEVMPGRAGSYVVGYLSVMFG